MQCANQWIVRSPRGFALVEVMMVVAIVGIMAGIAIPNYLSWKPGYEFRGAVSRVRSDLNKAKMRALETRKECRVYFCGTSYQIVDGTQTMYSSWPAPPSAGACLTTAQQTALETAGRRVLNVSLADYNQVSATTKATVRPIFSPRGQATGLATVTVKHAQGQEAEIRTDMSGRIRVEWK